MAQIIQISKVERRGDLWIVLVASPVAEVGWIIGGEHLTRAEAEEDAAWYRKPLELAETVLARLGSLECFIYTWQRRQETQTMTDSNGNHAETLCDLKGHDMHPRFDRVAPQWMNEGLQGWIAGLPSDSYEQRYVQDVCSHCGFVVPRVTPATIAKAKGD